MAHATRLGELEVAMERERQSILAGLKDLDAQAMLWYDAGVEARVIGAVCTAAECEQQLSAIAVRRVRLAARLELLRVRIQREKELRLIREAS